MAIRIRRLLPFLVAAVPLAPVAAQEGKTKVEVQVVGPADLRQPGFAYNVSPRGVHVGMVVAQGSRYAVSVDGTVGPRFDQILPVGGRDERIAFSSDGARYAYLGRLGQELVVMVDGKEFLRAPAASTTIQPGLPAGQMNPGFTPGGKHAYVSLSTTTSTPSTQTTYTMVVDGQAGPRSGSAIWPYFSPDGRRIAYIITNPANREQTALVVDGKPAGYPAGGLANVGGQGFEPRFTADGEHLFVYGSVPRGAVGVQVFVNGRPFLKAPGAHLFMAPAGIAFVTVVTGMDRMRFLDIGGKKVPGSEGTQIDSVYFSSDGKHWAATITTPAGSKFVMADGRKGLEYQSVGPVDFTADGKPVYTAFNGGRNFAIVGDQESNPYPTIGNLGSATGAMRSFVIAGNRVGFIAHTPGNPSAVFDFKPIARPLVASIGFSPDGSRFAFAWRDGLNVDGVDDASGAPLPFSPVLTGSVGPKEHFLFSPDSKHIAWFGQVASANAWGVHLDGKFLPVGGDMIHAPTFTPDSRHLLWMGKALNEPRNAVYLDGKEVLKFDFVNDIVNHPFWWEVGSDGVLTVAVVDQGSLKRVRITPGTETSIETMLSAAGKPR